MPRLELARAQEFLDLLAGRPGARFTFQTFDDDALRKEGALARVLHGTLDEVAPDLIQLNEAGAGIFVTVNETDLRGRKAANVTGLRALFIDKDDGPPGEFPVEPDLLVGREEDPARWHAYWLLQPGEPLDLFIPAQEALIAHYGSDDKIKDLPRVLRLPGFLWRKDAPPQLVRILRHEPGQRRTIEELMRAHGAWPLPVTVPPEPHRHGDRPLGHPPDDAAERAARCLEQALAASAVGNRNERAFWLACQLRDVGLGEADARPYLEGFASRAPRGESRQDAFTEREALGALRSAYSREARDFPGRPGSSGGGRSSGHEPDARAGRAVGSRRSDTRDPIRFDAAGVVLVVEEVRRTNTKRTATLRVFDAATAEGLGTVVVTTSRNGHREAERELLALLGDNGVVPGEEDARALRNLLRRVLDPCALDRARDLLARRAAEEGAVPAAPSMVEITTDWLRKRLEPAFVGTRGAAWSEKARRSVTAGEVSNLADSDLVAVLEAARDFAPGSDRDPLKPLRNAQIALRAAWANIVRGLPDEVHADHLGPDSAAARSFRSKLVELWTTCETWIKHTDGDGASTVERSSLAGRVCDALDAQPQKEAGARRVLRGVDFYFIDGRAESGDETRVHLAMRYTALRQLRNARIEGPQNQRDFSLLLRRYGLAAMKGEVPEKAGKGGDRVAVLSLELSQHLVFGIDHGETDEPAPANAPDGQAGAATGGETVDPGTGEIVGGRKP